MTRFFDSAASIRMLGELQSASSCTRQTTIHLIVGGRLPLLLTSRYLTTHMGGMLCRTSQTWQGSVHTDGPTTENELRLVHVR